MNPKGHGMIIFLGDSAHLTFIQMANHLVRTYHLSIDQGHTLEMITISLSNQFILDSPLILFDIIMILYSRVTINQFMSIISLKKQNYL